jgi:hypothetical protein
VAGPPKEKLMQDHTNGALPSREYKAYNKAHDAGRLEELADHASVRTPDGINCAVAIASGALSIDGALVSRFAEDRMDVRTLEGTAKSFECQESGGVPLKGTICMRLVDGRAESSLKNGERRFSARLSAATARATGWQKNQESRKP